MVVGSGGNVEERQRVVGGVELEMDCPQPSEVIDARSICKEGKLNRVNFAYDGYPLELDLHYKIQSSELPKHISLFVAIIIHYQSPPLSLTMSSIPSTITFGRHRRCRS